MAFPPIYEDLFQNDGEGPLLRPDIIPNTLGTENPDVFPEIELTGDTTGSGKVSASTGKYSVATTTAATSLKTARTIELSGQASGSNTFDGTKNISINVSSVKADQWNSTKKLELTGNVTGSVTSNWSPNSSDSTNNTISISTTIASIPSGLAGSMGSQYTSSKRLSSNIVGSSYTPSVDGYVVVYSITSSNPNWTSGIDTTIGAYTYHMLFGTHYSLGTDTCVFPVKANTTVKVASRGSKGASAAYFFST